MSKLPNAVGAVKGLEEWGHEWDCHCSSDYRGRLEEWDHEYDCHCSGDYRGRLESWDHEYDCHCSGDYRGRLLVGTVFGLAVHLVLTFCINNRAMNHVVDASTSSWLQEHMADMSERWGSLVVFIHTLENG